ncbi:MAG: bifunctional GNAT family N-acetyltransferase/class I SAM-dependent methyltransferase [Elusimicrobia bacterium]|nr:bifunctional GNAT family N-acetyltransferase/class I SAM-dependent methyltransferase [Candidatus Liberimonas magnetica]
MKTLLAVKESEKEIFNNFAANSGCCHIFQSYEWGEVKRGDGWMPHRYVVTEDGKIKASILLLEFKILFYSILYAPRGPILDYNDAETFNFLISELIKLPIFKNSIFLQIDPYVIRNDKLHNLLANNGFFMRKCGYFYIEQPKYVAVLDISPAFDEIYSKFHHHHKRNIKIAQKNNITVETRDDYEALEIFYKMLKATGTRKRFLVRPFSYQKRVFNNIIANGKGKIIFAKYNNEIIYGQMIFYFGSKSWYMYAASTLEHTESKPNYILVTEVIKWAKSLGITSLDFRGAGAWDLPNHPNRGIYDFKMRFGSSLCEIQGEYFMVFNKKLFSLYVMAGELLGKLLKLPGIISGLIKKLLNIFSSASYADKMTKLTFDKYGEKEELEEYTRRLIEDGLGFEEKFIDKYIKSPANILVEGCGAGRESIHLAKKGFSVTGTDFQPKMVESSKINAQKSGLKIDFKTMNACSLGFTDDKFDAIVIFGSTIAHIPGRQNRIKALTEAKRVLKKGGSILISVPSKHCNYKYTIYFIVMDNLRRVLNMFFIRTMETGDRLAKKVSGNVISKGKSFLHMYSVNEMIDDIHSAGLEFVEAKSRKEIMNDLTAPAQTEKDYFIYFSAKKI